MEIRAEYPPWRGPRRLRRRREEILIDSVRPARQLSRELMPMLVERGQLRGVHRGVTPKRFAIRLIRGARGPFCVTEYARHTAAASESALKGMDSRLGLQPLPR